MNKKISNFQAIMLAITLLLAFKIYAIEVTGEEPAEGSTGNPISSSVYFEIISDIDTIDVVLNTVEITINNDVPYSYNDAPVVQYSSLSNHAGQSYGFLITPEDDFDYGDSVYVAVHAEDNYGVELDDNWYFFIQQDNIAPFLSSFVPGSGEVDVDPGTSIYFVITDAVSGIDDQSLQVHIQSTTSELDETYFPGAVLDINGNDNYYTCELSWEDEHFVITDTVTVGIQVSDFAGNQRIYSYPFYIQENYNYTYVIRRVPNNNSTNVSVYSTVEFDIYNGVEGVYVDTTAIEVRFLNDTYNYLQTGHFELEPISPGGENQGYHVTILPFTPFEYNQIVNVEIDAEDTSGEGMATDRYSFRTIADNTAPSVSGWDPFPNEIDVATDTDIYFEIRDGLSGVNIDSVKVFIDSLEFNTLSNNFEYIEIDNGYGVTVTPLEPFTSEQTVEILIRGEDNLGNEMAINQNTHYYFTTEVVSQDEQPPFLLDIYPEDGEQNLQLDTVISFRVYDADPGINAESIRLRINTQPVEAVIEPEAEFGQSAQGYGIAYRVTYQLNDATGGPINWQVQVQDMIGNTYNDDWGESFNFTVTASLPPYINLPAEFIFLEDNDFEIDFRDYAGDPDGGFPELSVIGANNINVEVDDYMVTLSTAASNWNGQETLTFTVNDGIGTPVSDNVLVRVIAVNDPPVINLPEEGFSFAEDSSNWINFDQYVSDVDAGDQLLLAASGNTNVLITFDDLDVNISSTPDWNGIENVTFTVYDSGQRIGTSQEIPIEFIASPDLPGLDLPNLIIIAEDGQEVINFDQYIYDPEGLPLVLQAYANNNFTIDIDSTIVTLTPDENFTGDTELTFRIQYSGQTWVEDNTTVRVLPINDPPVFSLPDQVTVDEDSVLVVDFSPYISDVDNDFSEISLSYYGNQHIAVDIDSMTVTFTPSSNWNGTERMYFVAQDTEEGARTAQLTVVVNPMNDDPEINFPPFISFAEDTDGVFDLNTYIIDIDGDELSIEITGNDSISYVLNGMTVTFSAPENWYGTETLNFAVEDGYGGTASGSLQVTVSSVNDTPIINLPDQISFDEDNSLAVNFADSLWVTDLDNDVLTILVSGNSNISAEVIDGTTIIFSAEANWNGSEEITFHVFDGHSSEEVYSTMDVIVNPVNDPPSINLPREFNLEENDEFQIDMIAYITDVDLYDYPNPDELTIECEGSEHITVEIEDNEDLGVVIIPDANWIGTENLVFTVVDDSGESDSDDVDVVVTSWQNNHAPEINIIPTQFFDEDEELTIDFVNQDFVTDQDGNDLIITIFDNQIVEAAGSGEGSVITFSAGENVNGSEEVSILVDDQHGGYAQGTMHFEIHPVDDILQFNITGTFTVVNPYSIVRDITDYVVDVDDDDLTVTWEGNENININYIQNSFTTITIQGQGDWTGEEMVTFTVDDGYTPVSDSVWIVVEEAAGNHAPAFADSLPSTFTFNEDETFSFDFEPYIEDEDEDDEFVLTITDVNNHLHYQINGLVVNLWGDENWNDEDSVIFTVYDTQPGLQRAFDTAYINIVVEPVNDEPDFVLPESITFSEGEELQVDFSIYADDVDGDDLTLESPGGDSIFVDIANIYSVRLSSAENFIGQEYISFTVSDGILFVDDSLLVIVTESSINNPPVISEAFPDSVGFDEDTTYELDFNDYVTDDDDWMVTFTGNQYISTSVSNNIATFHPAADWNGTRTLHFTIYELRSRDQVTGQVSVTVFPVNDAPEINLPSQFLMDENGGLLQSFSNYLYDADGDDLILSVTGNDTIIVEINENVVNFTPLDNWFGTEIMTFTVTDPDSLSASDVVNVVVEQGEFNHPPVISLPEEIVLDEDTELVVDFSQYISDQDPYDELVLSAEYNESVMIEIEGLSVTFHPVLNWNGEITVNFSVYDTETGTRASASDEVLIVVNSVNDLPELDLPVSWSFENNVTREENFRNYTYDVDGDYLEISWDDPENIIIEQNGYYIYLSSEGWTGSEIVYFHATDDDGGVATDSIEVIVTAGHENHSPVFDLPDTLYAEEDTNAQFNFGPYMSDQDGDALIITAGYNSHIAIEVADSLVTLIPAENYFGSSTMTFTVYDSQGSRASASDDVIVYVEGINDAPTIDLPPSITFSNSDPYQLNFSSFIEDVDGETVTLEATGNSEISVEIYDYQVRFEAVNEFYGSENITFRVTDGEDETDSDVVMVTAVSGNVNTPPVINLPDEFTFEEDGVLEIDFEADSLVTDIDEDDVLSLLAYGGDNVIIEITGTVVTFTAEENWNGSENITFYVFDDVGRETASDEVEVIVTPVNDAPEINLPESFSIVESDNVNDWTEFEFTNYINDPDIGDDITLSVSGIDFVEVDIDNFGNYFRVNLRADIGNTGQDTLTFTVSDDSLSTSDDVIVDVQPGDWNHAPEFTELMPEAVSIKEDTVWVADFTPFMADADSMDTIVLTVGNVDNMDIVIDGMDVRITPDANWFGNTDITFTAYDTENSTRASASAVLDFTVRPQNDAPVLNLPEYISFEEDSEYVLNILNYASDIDGNIVGIQWEGDENINIVQGNGVNFYKIYLSEDDFIGSENITFIVEDDSTATGSDIVTVEVLAGQWNHTPTINLPEQFILTEDTPQQIDFGPFIADEDSTDLLIVSAVYNPYISVTVSEDTLVTLTPALNYCETTMMTFNVIDNVIDRAIASAQVEIVVEPVNDAPTIDLPVELSMAQNDTLQANFSYYVNDVDGDGLYLTSGATSHLNVQIAGLNVTILNIDEEWFGDEEISFTVWDDSLSSEDTMTIRVYEGSSNTPPEINLPAEGFTFDEDGELVVDFMAEGYVSDADPGDELFISVNGNHHVLIEIVDFEVTFTAEQDWFGTEEDILFYVFDDMSGRSTATAVTEVTVNPVNDPPVINLPPEFERSLDDFTPYVSINLDQYIDDIDSPFYDLSVSGQEHLQITVPEGTFTIIITMLEQWTGTDTVTFAVRDDSLAISYDTANIIITPGQDNLPPELNLPETINMVEDTPYLINFSQYASDPEGDDIVITLADNYDNLLFTINQLYVTITPAENWFGSQEVEFVIYDTEQRASDSGTVDIVVSPVNDAPVLELPDSYTIEENSMNNVIRFGEYMEDVDGDILSISWEGNEMITVANTGYNVYMTPDYGFVGEEMITFTVADAESAAIDSMLVIVELGTWNHAPELTLPSEGWTMEEDTQLQVDFGPYMNDIDEDDILQLFYTNNQYIDVVIEDSLVTFIPEENYFGTQVLEFSLADNYTGGRTVVTASAALEVTPVNDAPTISLPNNFGFSQSSLLNENFSHYINDIDSENLELTCSGNEFVSVNIEDMMVTFQLLPPNEDWFGPETITFIVTDDNNATATDSVLVTVYQGGINTPPEINLPVEGFTFDEDGTLIRDFQAEGYVSDEEGDELFLTVSDNENVTVDINGTIVTLGAIENWNGSENLTFWVIDEEGLATSDNVWIHVAPVNDAPEIDLPLQLSYEELGSGTEILGILILNDYFYDVDDNNNFTWEIEGEDNVGVNIETSGLVNITYIAEFSCESGWTGKDTLSFTVYDDDEQSGTDNITINVTTGNHAPHIELPELYSFNEDEPFTFDLTEFISDPDGDYLLVYPEGSNHISISIDPDTLVTLTPAENWSGTETISFTIHDSDPGQRLSAYDQMEITVVPVNDVPVLNLPDELSFEENGSLILNFNSLAYDVEDDVLDIEISGNDTITVTPTGYSRILSAPNGWTGQEMLTFRVTDSDSAYAEETLPVTVTMGNFNHAPVIDLPEEGFTLAEDTELQIDFSPFISDPDPTDLLVIDADNNANIGVSIAGNMVTLIPDANYNGDETLTFTITDNISRLQASDEVIVTVTPVNDPPVLTLPPELSISLNTYRTLDFSPFITDIDEGDSHTLTCGDTENIDITIDDLEVTMYSEEIGSEWVTFTVEDLAGANYADSLEIFVFAEQANNPPTITMPEILSFDEDGSLEVDFNLYIADVDGDDLSLLVTGNSMVNVDIAANEIVTFTAAENWNGAEELTFIVTDSYTFASGSVELVVNPVNDPPTLDLPDEQLSFAENTSLYIPFDLYMDDLDGDDLTIDFDPTSHITVELIQFSTTVRLTCEGWYGEETITFTVDDGIDQATDAIDVLVTEGSVNHAPEFVNFPASFEGEEDQVMIIDMSEYIYDLDNDPMYIDVTVNDEENVNIDIYGYTVYIDPYNNWNGEQSLTFIVIDDVGRAHDTAIADIIFNSVNDEPVITLPSEGFSFVEGSNLLLNFDQYLEDVDGDQLSLLCEGNSNITVQINGLSVNLSAAAYWSGTETLTFTVNDGNGGSASDDVDVTVEFVNDAPYIITQIQNFSIQEDSSYTSINLNNVFGDHDLEYGDELSYSWYGDLHLQVMEDDGNITLIPDPDWNGVETLIFRATDSEGLFVETSVNVTVVSVNDIPVVITDPSISAQADTSGFAQVWLSANDSYDIDGTIVSIVWSWEENGGGSVEGTVVQQAFEPGYYEITVTATDNQMGIGTATTILSVSDYDNQAPVAYDDYYEVYETQALIVHAVNGVLHNDQDPDNGPETLTAVLVSDPNNGILQSFENNGSFIYLAENIMDHDVTFTYQAYDGNAYSLIRTVHITVNEIVLEDAEITINSINTGGQNGVPIAVPVLSSELIPDWDVRSFEFDLQFEDGIVEYQGYDFDNVITDSMGVLTIDQTRGNIHCTYSSTEVITGEGALLNIEFFYYLGQTPLEITDFFFNQTEILNTNTGAVNNHYPTLSSAITFTQPVYEDFDPLYIDLDEHFSDLDGDDLSYSVDYDEDMITASITDNILELDSVHDQFGSPDVTITATDGYTLTEPYIYTFNPNILPVNDDPEINLQEYISFPEDSSMVMNIYEYISDPDYDDLTITWEGNTEINISLDDLLLTFSSTQDWNGSEMVTINVDDGYTGRVIASDTLEVIVTPVNDKPVLTLPVSISIDEDVPETRDFVDEGFMSDIEGDAILLSVAGNENIIVEIAGNEVTFSAPLNWNGNEDIIFMAQDDQGSDIVADTLQVLVRPVNDPPVIEGLPRPMVITENSTAEDNTFNFADSLWIYDVDGDILELTVDDGENIDIQIEGSIVTFEPVEYFVGNEDRIFTVNDNHDRLIDTYSLRIIVVNDSLQNIPPVLILPDEGISFSEDNSTVINFADSLTTCYVYDEEDDEILLIVEDSDNISASVNDLTVTFSAAQDFFGSDEVVVKAYNTRCRDQEPTIDTLLVNVSPVNDPPEIDLPEDIVIPGDTIRIFIMNQYLFDIDNDINDLTIQASGNDHVGVEITGTTVIFTSPEIWEGSEIIYFNVIDFGSIPAQDSLEVRVNQESINHPPVISLPANFTFNEDEEMQIDFTTYISDQDGDDLFLNVTGNDHVQVAISDYNVTLSAEEDWNGNEVLSFIVYDSRSRASDTDDIQVNVTPVNDPPRFDPVYDQIMERDQILEIEFANYVADLEGDSFYLSLSSGIGLDITQSSTKFTIIPNDDCPEVQNLTVTATENTSGLYSEMSFGLFVKAPVIDLEALTNAVNTGLFTFYENSGEHVIDFSQFLQSSYDITLTTSYNSSPDNDSLSVSLEDYDLTITPQNGWVGTVYIPFTATYLYNRARRDFEVKITVRADKSGENVVPLPHTVTWEDDHCVLRIDTGESPGDISAKILNRRGRLIKELSSEPTRIGENRYIYQWYKDDDDSNPVDGGLYIYQVDVNGKIYQGTIIIVR